MDDDDFYFFHTHFVWTRARTGAQWSSKYNKQQHPRTNKFGPKQSIDSFMSKKKTKKKKKEKKWLDENLSTIENVKSRDREYGPRRFSMRCDVAQRVQHHQWISYMFGNGARNN